MAPPLPSGRNERMKPEPSTEKKSVGAMTPKWAFRKVFHGMRLAREGAVWA